MIDPNELDLLRANPHFLGVSYIRFLPKALGARPIANLRRKNPKSLPVSKNKIGFNHLSINQTLQNVFQVLIFEKNRNPNLFASGASSQNDIHRQLKEYKRCIIPKILNKNGKLFFCKVDIKSCFDSIRHDVCQVLLDNIIKELEYVVQKYSIAYINMGKLKKEYRKSANVSDDFKDFIDFAAEISTNLRNALIVDQVVHSFEDREELMSILHQHISNHIVKIGRLHYRQIVGIPQGSILSSLLCGLVYGDMERRELSHLSTREDSMLIRYVDDFIFVSTEPEVTKEFAIIMHRGFPDYGCEVSREKSLVNFEIEIDGKQLHRIDESEGGGRFPWVGLLIDTNTLDVFADYSRLLDTRTCCL